MNLLIRGEKIKVTPAIERYIETKLKKLDKYFSDASSIKGHVLIKVNGKNQTIEVTIPIKKLTLRAEEKHSDLYAAIDLVVDKLESQIRKNKNRINDKSRKNDYQEFFLNYDEEEEDNSKIVKRKRIEVKPMDEEEAILQMELLSHDFFIFNSIDEGCISVIYKRKDGNYGIINTK